MLSRHVLIRDRLLKLAIEDLNGFILGRKEERETDILSDIKEKIRSITIKFQSEDTTIAQCGCYFNIVDKFIQHLAPKLNTDSAIVNNCDSGSALVKIKLDKKLTGKKEPAVRSLEVGSEVLQVIRDDSNSLLDVAMKRFYES